MGHFGSAQWKFKSIIQSKFIDEALDNIVDLEKALMALELSPNNKELVERVFRAMHSLKGGGAMFGFDRLSEFTNRMENIYEMVRSGKLCASSPLLSVTFQSVDLLRDLLEEPDELSPDLKKRYNDMEKAIDQVVKEETEKMLQTGTKCDEASSLPNDEQEGIATYFIHFYPPADVLKNGVNLFYLLEDLSELGQMYAMPGVQGVPAFQKVYPAESYLFWDIFLTTDKGVNAIRDVFIFVEDGATLEVHRISRSNLFDTPAFKEKINEISERQKKVDLTEITRLAQTYGVTSSPAVEKSKMEEEDEKEATKPDDAYSTTPGKPKMAKDAKQLQFA
jgi:two-component system chemotaxis sensor kinase CheA